MKIALPSIIYKKMTTITNTNWITSESEWQLCVRTGRGGMENKAFLGDEACQHDQTEMQHVRSYSPLPAKYSMLMKAGQ